MEHTPHSQLSETDIKVTLLALAHLSNFLPEWEAQLRLIAAKLSGPEGLRLFDRLKNMEHSEAALVAINVKVLNGILTDSPECSN